MLDKIEMDFKDKLSEYEVQDIVKLYNVINMVKENKEGLGYVDRIVWISSFNKWYLQLDMDFYSFENDNEVLEFIQDSINFKDFINLVENDLSIVSDKLDFNNGYKGFDKMITEIYNTYNF